MVGRGRALVCSSEECGLAGLVVAAATSEFILSRFLLMECLNDSIKTTGIRGELDPALPSRVNSHLCTTN